jgi:hypothetical protein
VTLVFRPSQKDDPVLYNFETGQQEMRTTTVAMGIPRWALAAGSLMTIAALSACGSTSSSPNTTSSLTATTLTSAELASKLEAGSTNLTSAHLTLSSKVGDRSVLTAQGDETLADGKVTAMRLNEQAGTIKLTILLVDGGVYLKLPSNLNQSGKPWVKATTESSSPVLRQLAASASSIGQSASLSQYKSLAEAARSLKVVGTERVNGAAVTHYSLTVDVAKVPSTAFTQATKTALEKAGVTEIPEDLWVDENGRPVKGSNRFILNGQVVTSAFTISRLNQPVTITVPPASQLVISISAARLPLASKVGASVCNPAPPATASAAAIAYWRAVVASWPARQELDATLTAEGFRIHRNDLIAQVNADAPFLSALRAIKFPAQAQVTAQNLITTIQTYDALLRTTYAHIGYLSNTGYIAKWNSETQTLNDARAQQSALLRDLLSLPPSTCALHRP